MTEPVPPPESKYLGNWPRIDRFASAAKAERTERLLAEAWLTVDCVVIGEESGVNWPLSNYGVVCVAETPELARAIAEVHNRDGGHV